MRSSSQKIIVRYFLQFIPGSFACAPYRESSAREIIIRHFLHCMHTLRSRACRETLSVVYRRSSSDVIICRVVSATSPSPRYRWMDDSLMRFRVAGQRYITLSNCRFSRNCETRLVFRPTQPGDHVKERNLLSLEFTQKEKD